MFRLVKILTVALLFVLSTSMANTALAEEYRLGAGDVLAIGVYGIEELQVKDLAIRPDGKIAFPLAGEVVAAGKTAAEFNAALTTALSEYVKDPQVTVNVQKFRTTRVYVLGEVNMPGLYELEKAHNVLDAVGIAKGYTKDAAKKKVFVVHKDKPGETIKINLNDIMTKGDLSQNIALSEGDVVYVTRSSRIEFARDILPLLSGAYYITHFGDN